MKPRITELDMSPFDDQNVDLYTPINQKARNDES